MDKKLQFTGGEPNVKQNQLTIDPDANRPAMFAMFNSYAVDTNPNFILDGCAVAVGGSSPNNTWSLAVGYIFLNNEILQVDADSGTFDSATEFLAFDKTITYNALGDKTFVDGTPRQTWQQNRGTITVQGSVSITELDAIAGDHVWDKIVKTIKANSTEQFNAVNVVASSTTQSGVVEQATSSEIQALNNDRYITAQGLYSNFDVGDVFQATTTVHGIVEKATTAETQDGTADKYPDATLFQEHKTVNKGFLSVAQSGGTYSIVSTSDVFHFTDATPPTVTMPDPTAAGQRNRVIVIYSTTSSTITISNTGVSGSQEDEFYPANGGITPGTAGAVTGEQITFLSDGTRWITISNNDIPACPYIYVNGKYFEEILRNFRGINNYKEDVLDITGVLNQGDNTIRISEEKKETTYIDYLILELDGEERILFGERKTMIKGDFYDFDIKIDSEFNQAKLKAKGYYTPG